MALGYFPQSRLLLCSAYHSVQGFDLALHVVPLPPGLAQLCSGRLQRFCIFVHSFHWSCFLLQGIKKQMT